VRLHVKIGVCVVLAAAAVSFFASAAFCAENMTRVDVTKTASHVALFDIPVYIAPAAGVRFSRTETGCADAANRISLEASQLRVPYDLITEDLSDDSLKKNGIEVKLRSEFLLNGSRATLIKAFQRSGKSTLGKWILLIDRGGAGTWMINGLYDSKDQRNGQAVLDMLRSVWWDEEGPDALNATAPLSIRTDGTPFRLACLQQNAIVYTKDGKLPTESADGAMLVVSQEQCTPLLQKEMSVFAKERMKLVEKDKDIEIVSERDVCVDGLRGIELVACTGEETSRLVYQMALFDRDSCSIIVGMAHAGVIENLETFRMLAESYAQKPAYEKE